VEKLDGGLTPFQTFAGLLLWTMEILTFFANKNLATQLSGLRLGSIIEGSGMHPLDLF